MALVLGVPEGTVKSRLNRGRAELARILRRQKVVDEVHRSRIPAVRLRGRHGLARREGDDRAPPGELPGLPRVGGRLARSAGFHGEGGGRRAAGDAGEPDPFRGAHGKSAPVRKSRPGQELDRQAARADPPTEVRDGHGDDDCSAFSMLARFAGIPVRQLKAADLEPARVWAALEDKAYRSRGSRQEILREPASGATKSSRR